jgi:hypothetical protein
MDSSLFIAQILTLALTLTLRMPRASASSDFYGFVFEPVSPNDSVNSVVTGICNASSSLPSYVYLSGYSFSSSSNATGLLYHGPWDDISSGTWTKLVVPSAVNKTVTVSQYFSPATSGAGSLLLVGNYRTSETDSKYDFGFYYAGSSNGTGSYTDLKPSTLVTDADDAVLNTYPRSLSNDLVVGYYSTKSTPKVEASFVYSISSEAYYALLFPAATSISAHAIYWTGVASTYVIVGSITESGGTTSGFTCTWNGTDHTASDYQLYQRSSDATETHFNGIYPNSADTSQYYVVSNWVETTTSNVKSNGISLVSITSIDVGSSTATWTDFDYTGSVNDTVTAIYSDYVTGSMQLTDSDVISSYLASFSVSGTVVSTNPSSSKSSTTTIIATVVCVVVGVVIIAGFMFYRQRLREQAAESAAAKEARSEMTPSQGGSSSPMYDSSADKNEKGVSMFSFKSIS